MIYRSLGWLMARPLMRVTRQLGLDQTQMVVLGAMWSDTRTDIPPEWDRGRGAFLRTCQKC